MEDHKFLEFPFADYLLVFISIIVGYVVTEFFNGWGTLLRNRKQIKFYWLHLFWTFNFFIQLIENWWWLWGNRIKLAEHVWYFIFSLVSPLIFYLISVFLFPKLEDDKINDFERYYYKNVNPLFSLFSMLMLTYFINNIWVKEQSIFSIDNIFCITGFAFSFTYMAIKKPWFHIMGYTMGTIIFLGYVYLNSVK